MDAVIQGCSVRRAAEEHRVPITTLQDRISGKVFHGTIDNISPMDMKLINAICSTLVSHPCEITVDFLYMFLQ